MSRIARWAAALLAALLPSIAPAASTFITLQSDAGDPMGDTLAGAAAQPFTNLNGTITVSSNARNGVSIRFAPSPGTENLFIDLGPRSGDTLVTGRYEIPLRFPVAPPTRPALEVYRDNHRCSDVAGRFLVLELVRDATGAIVRFAADFEQHCDASVPALYGGVRINSDVPYAQTLLPRSATLLTPGGFATLSVVTPHRPCALLDTESVQTDDPPGPAVFPYGIIAFRAVGCDPDVTGAATFSLDLGKPPEGTVVFWKFGPTPDNRTAHWYTIPVTVSGNVVSFEITDQMKGDDDLSNDNLPDGIIYSYGGLTFGRSVQDMWWAGPAENGWGMSVVQHGGALFNVIYLYDAAGNPTWLDMPDGQWSGPYGAYTGALYRPHGTPYYAYDSAGFTAGNPVGTATITFSDLDHARLDYTVDGVSGHKDIVRQLFGPPAAVLPADRSDMYWGGPAQNGYGFAVIQQQASVFTVWFTYDANGAPTWFVMPAGSWTEPTLLTTYAGRMYRATGSPWVGVPYDPSRLRVTDVGSFSLHFDDPTSTFEYSIEDRLGTLPLVPQPF